MHSIISPDSINNLVFLRNTDSVHFEVGTDVLCTVYVYIDLLSGNIFRLAGQSFTQARCVQFALFWKVLHTSILIICLSFTLRSVYWLTDTYFFSSGGI
jgi:hypothetical protein